MFDFFKKKEEKEDVGQMLEYVEMASKILLLELQTGDSKWSDEKVQFFLPVALYFTSFAWLDLLAKHEFEKDYEVISKFLEDTQKIAQVKAMEMEAQIRGY